MSNARKDPALDRKHKAILKSMQQRPENKCCADCLAPSPRWASTNLGVFLCISCSGIHRKIGTHVSKVRSTTLDVWTAEQMTHFTALGNGKAATLYEARLPPNFRRPTPASSLAMEKFIRDKYERRMYASPEAASVAPPSVFPSAASVRAQSYVEANPRNQPLGPRPSIYAMLPTKKGSYDSRGSNLNAHSYSNQFMAAGQPSNDFSSSRPLGHLSPVSTSLIEMGFPPELSTQAADRFGNDLQKAADWVLRQKSVRLYNAPAPRRSPRPVPVPDMLMDITGTNAAKSAPPPPAAAVPKAFGTESLLGASMPVSQNTGASQGNGPDDDGFTDFSSFKTALPDKTTASPPSTVSTAGNTSLNATLAGLYAKGPAKSPVGVSAMPRSPQMANRIGTFSTNGNQLGGQARTCSTVKANQQPKAAFSTIPSSPQTQKSAAPPPPVSIEIFSGGNEQPLPPSPRKVEKIEPAQEEEDPFAFLAKEALSSASKKKQLNAGSKSVMSGAKADVAFNKDSSTTTQTTGTDFSFDDLLK